MSLIPDPKLEPLLDRLRAADWSGMVKVRVERGQPDSVTLHPATAGLTAIGANEVSRISGERFRCELWIRKAGIRSCGGSRTRTLILPSCDCRVAVLAATPSLNPFERTCDDLE